MNDLKSLCEKYIELGITAEEYKDSFETESRYLQFKDSERLAKAALLLAEALDQCSNPYMTQKDLIAAEALIEANEIARGE